MRAIAGNSFGLDPERQAATLILGGVGLIVLFAFVLIAIGFYTSRIAPDQATVIQIGDRKFDYAFLERRAQAELARGRFDATNVGSGLSAVIALVEREELTREAAASLGVTATEEEIDARYRARLGIPRNAARDQIGSRVRADLLRLGLSFDEYRESVVADVLGAKLRDQFEAAVPDEVEYVELHLIETASQAAAIQALDRLEGDESFATVARELSIHPSASTSGSDLSWVPIDSLPPGVDEVAAILAFGARSEIIETPITFFIIEASGREMRAIDGDGREDIGRRRYNELLAETRERLNVIVTLTPSQVQRLAVSLSTRIG